MQCLLLDTENEFEENETNTDIFKEIILPGSFIALHSFSSFEQFDICRVVELCTAEKDEMDDNGHAVSK